MSSSPDTTEFFRSSGHRTGRSAPRSSSPWLTLIVLCIGQAMIVIDQNIVNVALPTVQQSLGFSEANLVWVVNAYVIPFGGLLLLAGRLGDIVGRRSVFITGMTVFSLASLLCGFATTEGMLIGFRFVQGMGGAIASACLLAMVVATFSEPRQSAQAIGAYSFASAGGGAVGQLLGGVLTGFVSWNWIFFVNAPIGLLVVILALRLVPKDVGHGGLRNVDYIGAVLVTGGLMFGVYTIVNGEAAGWASTQTLLLAVVSVLLLAAFLAREATARDPLLPLTLFRSRTLTMANVVQFLTIAGMFGLLYFGTLYLQNVLGYSAIQAGLGFVPIAVVIAVVSLGLSARVIGRLGERTVLLGGLALVALAFAMLAGARVNGNYAVDFLPASLTMGLGFGLVAPAAMGLGMAAVHPQQSGVASGLFNTTQQIGGAVGLAVLSAIASARTGTLVRQGSSEVAALNGSYQATFIAAAVFVLGAFLVAAIFLRKPPRTRSDEQRLSPHRPRVQAPQRAQDRAEPVN